MRRDLLGAVTPSDFAPLSLHLHNQTTPHTAPMGTAVDTSIHPHATGPAAELVAAHSADYALKLYAGWFCPFVQRAWMVLVEKRIAHQYVEINPYHKSPEFLALNPRGLVPALVVPAASPGRTTKPLYESAVLCEFLDEAFADQTAHGPRLLPDDAYERAVCRIWMDHVAGKIVPAWYRLMQHTAEKPYGIHEARAELHTHLLTLAREMANGGPWFLGERFTLVDVMLAPWAVRLWLIDYYKDGGVGIPDPESGGEDETAWKRWRTWLAAIEERRSVVETSSTKDMYIGVYKRYADDTTNSEVGQATRSGRRLP